MTASPQMDSVPADIFWRRAVWAIVLAGAALRIGVWLQAYPLWHDEAATAANFLDRSFGDFPRPLDYTQVAPLGYVWAEVAAVKRFGFGERSVRLVALLCGVGGLAIFGRLSLATLRGPSSALAVAFLAVASYPVRHAVEVKPYAGDLLVSATLVLLAWRAHQRPSVGRLATLAAFGPIALLCSFPAVFVLGGCLLSLAPALWRSDWKVRGAWAGAGLLAAGTFFVLLRFTMEPQHQAHAGGMTAHWGEAFPPRTGVLPMLRWCLEAATGVAFAYPLGGGNSASTLTTLLVVVGVVSLWKRDRWLPCCAAAVVALALAAAILHRYPFGGHARVMQYLGPFVCLFAGTGVAALIRWRPRFPESERRRLALAFSVLGAIGVGLAARAAAKPYAMLDDVHARAFARWFWQDHVGAAPTVQATDLLEAQHPGAPLFTPQFRCYRAIYAAGPTATLRESLPRLDRETAFVVHYLQLAEKREQVVADWRRGMERAYRLVREERFDVNPGKEWHGVYLLLTFAPGSPGGSPDLPGSTATIASPR